MGKEKRLFTYIEIDDKTPVQKLPIRDQLHVLLKQLTYDPANELKNDDIVTVEYMTLKANLLELLRKATDPIRIGDHSEVVLNIDSAFSPVFEEVMTSHEIADFYDVSIVKPKIEFDIPYNYLVRLRVKKK